MMLEIECSVRYPPDIVMIVLKLLVKSDDGFQVRS